jgi:hypothetical protein
MYLMRNRALAALWALLLVLLAGCSAASPTAWAPDGAWIAFTRRTDHGDLYVMRPDGSGQRMLPGFASAEFTDCCPMWRPLHP